MPHIEMAPQHMWAGNSVQVFIEENSTTEIWGRVKMRTSTTEKGAGRVNRQTLGLVKAMEFATTTDMAAGISAAKAKAFVMAEAMGADTIINLTLEIAEMSNGLFSAIASGQAVITMARRSPLSSYFADAELDDVALKPFMLGAALRGISSLVH